MVGVSRTGIIVWLWWDSSPYPYNTAPLYLLHIYSTSMDIAMNLQTWLIMHICFAYSIFIYTYMFIYLLTFQHVLIPTYIYRRSCCFFGNLLPLNGSQVLVRLLCFSRFYYYFILFINLLLITYQHVDLFTWTIYITTLCKNFKSVFAYRHPSIMYQLIYLYFFYTSSLLYLHF